MRLRKPVLFAVFALGVALEARAESTVCTNINAMPAPRTISGNGIYCLTATLNVSDTTGAAITVNASTVTIDLNGFRLGGATAGIGTSAIGIHVTAGTPARTGVNIKNGYIRGFYKGIFIDDDGTNNSKAHVIEDVRVELSKYAGIHVKGLGNTIRNSSVVDTGCAIPGNCAAPANTDAIGVWMQGPGNRVLNVDVAGTGEAVGLTNVVAILLGGPGSLGAFGAVVEGNRIGNAAAGVATAVQMDEGDVQVVGNRMVTMLKGVFYNIGVGKYRDNLTSGVTNPYSGNPLAVDAGNNQ